MSARRVLVIAGVVAFALGLVAIVSPGLAALALDRVFVSVVGVVALLQALRVVQARRRRDLTRSRTPDPEALLTAPLPGGDLDEALGQFTESRRLSYRRTRAERGLRAAAIAVLTEYGNDSEHDAEARLERGTWTDDPYAAAFLGGPPPEPSIRARLRAAIGGRGGSRFERNARRTANAIVDQADLPSRSTARATDDARERADRGPVIGSGESSFSFDAASRRAGVAVTNGADTMDWSNITDGADATDGTRGANGADGTNRIASRDPRSTGHWYGVSVVALVSIGVGALVEQSAVLLAGVVGVGFAAYTRSATPPNIDLSIDRTLDDERPAPGEEVEVTLTVANEGDRSCPDLRLVDGVPDTLAVAEGSPRLGTALRSGEEATLTYTVTTRRGVHAFDSTLVIARDLTGSIERESVVETGTELRCLPRLRATAAPVPLRESATRYAGQVTTSTGGEGVEFHATREHRPGDPMNRIDWRRRARTGEFATLEFREERAATVLVVIDTRESAYIAPGPETPHAVDRAVDATGRVFAALLDEGNRAGIAAFGPDPCWLAPDTGVDHRTRVRESLATDPAFASIPQRGAFRSRQWLRTLRRRLRTGTQVVFLSPLCDEYAATVARRLDAYGYPTTVISPDPTTDRTAEQRLTRLGRALRITDLRRAGVRVVDWPWDDSLDAALARFAERRPG